MGGAIFPPCSLAWAQTMVGVMEVMETSFQRACTRTVVFSVPDPTAGHGRPKPPQEIPGHSQQVWLSLFWGQCSFLLNPSAQKVLFVPSKSLFSQSCGSSAVKSHCPSKPNSLGVLSPFADPQAGKYSVSPRTVTTVGELLWYNCSPVCGLPAQCLYGGVHTQRLPGLLQPVPLSQWQTTADHPSAGDPQTFKSRSGSVSCGVSGSCAHKVF